MKSKKTGRKLFTIIFSIFVLIFLFTLFVNIYIISYSNDYIYSDINEVPHKYAAIVPGASVYSDTTVSLVLRDRIEGAIQLIKNGNCVKFLVTGDHGTKEYDEVNASRKYVLHNSNLDESLIFMDHAGFSTYESMYRARDVFCVKDCCVVTQEFHIYRSVFLARKMGLDAVGYVAPEITKFSKQIHFFWNCREYFARIKAFIDLLFDRKPKYLGNKISVYGDGHLTWE